ncbi:hypothetical protein [Nocardia arthritidis]|uniref:Helix-turn-helix domain-containing protein n=1 Tax=Nocardia arthritidis TaxID=228602 RepID=A0A6G9YU99_9NOCA|nr:hypothetical protein [Nocardia arthritidis]QIS16443.1 helix-turn-helix domain-containing protein [Nocardia arthritidis]QIS16457.1 helix-turn-helix domain-containing protein [Nocardia arthritidis]
MSWNYIPGSLLAEPADIETLKRRISELERENTELRRKTDNRKKLSAREVELIRRLGGQGYPHRMLAESFDVNKATISRTINGTYHKAE